MDDYGQLTLGAIAFVLLAYAVLLALAITAEKRREREEKPKVDFNYFRGIDLRTCPKDFTHAQRCKWLMEQEPGKGFFHVKELSLANQVWLVHDMKKVSS